MTDKIVKTVLKVTVLADGRIDDYSLETIGREIVHGSWSGNIEVEEVKELNKKEAIKECEAQGTDPAFFFGDEEED